MIYIADEEMLKYLDFKFDSIYLYDNPDELSFYFKLFKQLKEKGKLYLSTLSNEYKSKIEFFEKLVKFSL